jgi:trk system potassium uptake protein TrkA
MHVVIVGCGRPGSALAARLDSEGDSVCVIDRDDQARKRLPGSFTGTFVTGHGLSRAALEAAGTSRADALAALTSSDSLNIVAARLARDSFRVPRVVARLHEAERAPVCAELGIPVVTSVRMTVDRVHRMLRHSQLQPEQSFGNGESHLVRAPVPGYLAGRGAAEFNVTGEIQVVEITRGGRSTIPAATTTLREGDMVSFVVASGSLSRLRSFLGGRWH